MRAVIAARVLAEQTANGSARRGHGRQRAAPRAVRWISTAALSLAALLVTGETGAQTARRSIPSAMREALVGCWDLGNGETYVIAPHGAHGLRARWTATGRRGAPEQQHGSMYYDEAAHAVTAGCGAQSQHGQHCLFALADGAITVTTVSERSGRGTSRTAQRCSSAASVPEDPGPDAHPVPADAPIRALLVQRRRDIDAGRTPTGEADGWTRYGDSLAILFDHAVAMRVRARLTATTCEEAAALAGFPQAEGTAPLRRSTGCEWPGISARHRLAPHVAGRWTAADGVIEIWRIE